MDSNDTFDGVSSVTETFEGLQKSDFQVEWDLFYSKFVTHKGYKDALTGLANTMKIAVMGLLIGIVIGTLIALVKMIPKYHVLPRILSAICDVYVGFFRGTPMVVQLLIGWFILLPALDLPVDNVVVATAVFGLNSGAYVSEIMRSGIQAVDAGQLEAARAVGLGYWTSMMKIVIPQGVKNILPTLGNEFIVLVKDTSIVSFIAVVDVTKAFRQIGDANYSYIIPYLMLALVYLVIVMIITLLIKLLERRLAKSERRK
jgi:polar amino acid transport system permease protein